MKKILIAEKGMSKIAPENSLTAFSMCQKYNVKWFKWDLKELKDGNIIASTSDNIARCGDRCGKYSELSINEIVGIDVGSWFSDKFISERVPLLDEIIDCANEKELNMVVNIEKKIENLEVKFKKFEGELLFISNNVENLKDIEDRKKVALKFEEDLSVESIIKILKEFEINKVILKEDSLNDEIISRLKENKIEILASEVNSLIRANELFNYGVFAIFTEMAHEFPNKYRK